MREDLPTHTEPTQQMKILLAELEKSSTKRSSHPSIGGARLSIGVSIGSLTTYVVGKRN
jgi:hypothetical protein